MTCQAIKTIVNCDGLEYFFVSSCLSVFARMKSLWQHKISFHCHGTWVAVSDEFMRMILFQKWSHACEGPQRTFIWIKIVIIFYKNVHSTLRSDTAWKLWHIFLFVRRNCQFIEIDFLRILFRRSKALLVIYCSIFILV